MTERFTLAANVLLSRRLQNILRIDENVQIDMSYITCAEYQLFIDEKLKAGKHRQPKHWTSYRLLPGDAKKPITGVRSSDAKEFCEWLNQQQSAQGFKYRVPTLAEVEEYPVTEKQVGCWCFDGEQRIIAGIETGQKQTWEQKLVKVLVLNHNYRDLYCDLDRNYRDLYRDLSRDLNRVLNGTLGNNLYTHLDRIFNRDLYRVLDWVFNRDRDRHLSSDLKHFVNCNLDRVLNRYLKHDLDRVLNRNFNRSLNQELNRVLNPKIQAIRADKASNFLILYFPVLFVIVICHWLSKVYEVMSTNREALNIIKLNSKTSENLSLQNQININKLSPFYV